MDLSSGNADRDCWSVAYESARKAKTYRKTDESHLDGNG